MNDNNQALKTTGCRGCGGCTGACESAPKTSHIDPQRFTTFDPLNELYATSKALAAALRAGSDPAPYLRAMEAAVAMCDELINERDAQCDAVEDARDMFESDDISIDDDPIVAVADDGVWVSAWLWVEADDE